MRRFAAVIALPLVFFVLVLSSCADDDADDTPAPTSTEVPAPTGSATAPGPTDEPLDGARDPVEGTLGSDGGTSATLVDVRAAAHESFDRVVFEFDGGAPSYTVEYVEDAAHCGSGEPLEAAGGATLQVRFMPAAAHTDAGEPTINFTELSADLPAVLEVVSTCDFEADVTWIIAVATEADFRVTPLEDPIRLAIDIAHPE